MMFTASCADRILGGGGRDIPRRRQTRGSVGRRRGVSWASKRFWVLLVTLGPAGLIPRAKAGVRKPSARASGSKGSAHASAAAARASAVALLQTFRFYDPVLERPVVAKRSLALQSIHNQTRKQPTSGTQRPSAGQASLAKARRRLIAHDGLRYRGWASRHENYCRYEHLCGVPSK